MESKLRAPDPTLSALDDVLWVDLPRFRGVAVAHLYGANCSDDLAVPLHPRSAAFVAVPCRECFPDAPPRGWREESQVPAGIDGRSLTADPHLAWQFRDE